MVNTLFLLLFYILANTNPVLGSEAVDLNELNELKNIKASILNLNVDLHLCELEIPLKKDNRQGCDQYAIAIGKDTPNNPLNLIGVFMGKVKRHEIAHDSPHFYWSTSSVNPARFPTAC